MRGEGEGIEPTDQLISCARERMLKSRLTGGGIVDGDGHGRDLIARRCHPKAQRERAYCAYQLAADAPVRSAPEILEQAHEAVEREAKRGDLKLRGLPAGGNGWPLAAPMGGGSCAGDGIEQPVRQHLAPQAALLEVLGNFDPLHQDRLAPGLGYDRPQCHHQDGYDCRTDEQIAQPLQHRAERSEAAGEQGQPVPLVVLRRRSGKNTILASRFLVRALAHDNPPPGWGVGEESGKRRSRVRLRALSSAAPDRRALF